MNLSYSIVLVAILRSPLDQREKKRDYIIASSFNLEHVREHRESLYTTKVITTFLIISGFS